MKERKKTEAMGLNGHQNIRECTHTCISTGPS